MDILNILFGRKRYQTNRKKNSMPLTPDFPFELLLVPGQDALMELDRLEEEGAAEGFRPIIVGDEREFDFFADQFECAEQTFEEIIRDAKTISPDDFFEQRVQEDPAYYELEPGQPAPDENEKGGLITHLDSRQQNPKEWIFIAIIPDRNAHHIPAHFNYGGWNDCPAPAAHVALWRYWQERYQAEIVCVTHDVIEAKVKNPPKTYEAAMVLAREQFIYCGDIIHQGVGSLEGLATLLQNGRTWYFWWD